MSEETALKSRSEQLDFLKTQIETSAVSSRVMAVS
jgi:hypothetical protein